MNKKAIFSPEQRQAIMEIVQEERTRQGGNPTWQSVQICSNYLEEESKKNAEQRARIDMEIKEIQRVVKEGRHLESIQTIMKRFSKDNDVPYEKVEAIMLSWVKQQYFSLTGHEAD